jgi:hypothetical protein
MLLDILEYFDALWVRNLMKTFEEEEEEGPYENS